MLRDDRLWWILIAMAAAAGVALGRRSPAARPAQEAAPAAREPWTCACGQAFLVAGRDRHRVYWLAGADESDPVLGGRCPSCDRPLPAESAVSAGPLAPG
jgi:hypothetical protein